MPTDRPWSLFPTTTPNKIYHTVNSILRQFFYSHSLQRNGIEKQEIVVIALDHSIELVAAFWGVLYCGVVPIITHYPGHVPNRGKYKEQICKLVKNSGARSLITMPELSSEFGKLLQDSICSVISSTEILPSHGDIDTSLPENYASSEEIGYIQYTSGSTGRQKGVRLSHRAILNFIKSYAVILDIQPGDVIVNWPPLYHDLGLFSGTVLPLITGIPLVLLSPFKWVLNPKALLEAIQKYRGTHCIFPNFGLNHTLRQCEMPGPEGYGSQLFTVCRARR